MLDSGSDDPSSSLGEVTNAKALIIRWVLFVYICLYRTALNLISHESHQLFRMFHKLLGGAATNGTNY